jgi:hypothetical protein
LEDLFGRFRILITIAMNGSLFAHTGH